MPSVDNLQQGSNQPHQKYHPPTHVPTLFKWNGEWGNHVCIAGSFDPPIPTWNPIEMPKNKDNVHVVTLDLLPDKKYYYKFVIDGNWVTDEKITSFPDSSGNWNHEIQVELPPPSPPPEEKEIIIEEQLQQEIVSEEQKEEVIIKEKHEHQEEVVEEKHEEEHREEVIVGKHEEEHQEEIVEEKHEEEHREEIVEEKHDEQHQEEEVVEEHEEQYQKEVVVEEKHEGLQEEVVEEKYEEEVLVEEKHDEQHQEEEVIEKHEGQYQEEVVVEEKHIQYQEEVVVEEKHIKYQEEVVVEEKHIQYQEEIVVEEKHQEKVVTDEHQEHQEEAVDKDHKMHQEDHQVVAEDHHVDENEQQYQEKQVIDEEHQEQAIKEEHQHQEDQVENHIEELHQHKDDQKEDLDTETITDVEPDKTFISTEHISSSSIVKETIIDDVIIEGTHDESMTTKTLYTSQNDTEPINVIDENVEEVTANVDAEISEIERLNKEVKVSDDIKEPIIEQSEDTVDESKITEETLSTVGEKETEIPIDYSNPIETHTGEAVPPSEMSYEEKIYEPEQEEYEENDNYENEGAREGNEYIKTELCLDENLPEETIKEVLLYDTWAKDDTNEDSIPSSWTETYESKPLVWPDDENLEWSDVDKAARNETTTTEVESHSEQVLENTHESEEVLSREIHSTTEVVLSCEISSTVLVEETIIEQAESIVGEIPAQSIIESHIEQSDYEAGINITSEVKESSPYEKPESSATADEISATPTAAVVEEIITSKAIDKLKSDEEKLEVDISRKIISISPSTSSPGESTRNADIYTHNITVATNASRSPTKETVNIKSKHKKPVEITSRGILQSDSKHVIQNDDCEEEKVDLNDIAYLVTSVATTFTLGIISMMYTSVFGTKNK